MREDPERLQNLLGEVGARLGLGSPADVGKVWARWREIVGPGIADHADPTSLREGVLRVRADSPAWATEIGYLGGEIRSRINEAVGSALVAEVRVWIGARKEARPTLESSRGTPSPKPLRPAGSDDPEQALERARRAWARATGTGPAEGRPHSSENREKRR
ncbi:MAG: DUF721 domain-containing protein [Actinomycetota bacterium]|nr:DUF721 domain-containing protein [Actinomycetota bacterium]